MLLPFRRKTEWHFSFWVIVFFPDFKVNHSKIPLGQRKFFHLKNWQTTFALPPIWVSF